MQVYIDPNAKEQELPPIEDEIEKVQNDTTNRKRVLSLTKTVLPTALAGLAVVIALMGLWKANNTETVLRNEDTIFVSEPAQQAIKATMTSYMTSDEADALINDLMSRLELEDTGITDMQVKQMINEALLAYDYQLTDADIDSITQSVIAGLGNRVATGESTLVVNQASDYTAEILELKNELTTLRSQVNGNQTFVNDYNNSNDVNLTNLDKTVNNVIKSNMAEINASLKNMQSIIDANKNSTDADIAKLAADLEKRLTDFQTQVESTYAKKAEIESDLQAMTDYVNTTTDDLQTQIDTLSTRATTCETNIQDLQERVGTLEGSMATLLGTGEGSIYNLQRQITENNTTVNSRIDTEVANLNAEITALNQDINTYKEYVAATYATIANLELELNNVDTRITNETNTINNNITNINNRLNNLGFVVCTQAEYDAWRSAGTLQTGTIYFIK